MPHETTKAIVREFLEGTWDYDKLEARCKWLAPDYVLHGPTGDLIGCRAFREAVAGELENIGNMFVKVEDEIAEGDRVVARTTTWFELHGEFMGAYPTGQTMKLQGLSVHRVADGKIAESWEPYDRRSLLHDLGAAQGLSEDDRNAILGVIADALRNGLRDKQGHGDRYYAESAEVVAANGEAMRGRRSIVAWLERFPPISEWKLTDLEIDGAGEVAYVRGSYTMQLSSRAKLPFDKGKYLEVWRKQADGTWKVIRHVFSSEIASRSRARAKPALAHA
jgi:predicted ester cyclase/ketosteroid isomerase-like protein